MRPSREVWERSRASGAEQAKFPESPGAKWDGRGLPLANPTPVELAEYLRLGKGGAGGLPRPMGGGVRHILGE